MRGGRELSRVVADSGWFSRADGALGQSGGCIWETGVAGG